MHHSSSSLVASTLRPLGLTPLFLLLAPALRAETEFGTVLIRQLAGGNEASAVSATTGRGGSSGATVTGANRGDYNVSFGYSNDPATGVLISCPAQNTRDDSALGGPAVNPHHATTAVQVSGSRYYIPVFRSPEGDEANLNTSFAFLPYATWLGGVAANAENGGEINSLTGSPGLVLGTHFIDTATAIGEYKLKLQPLVANAAQKGILLVSGAKNEDNFAQSRANSDGSFTIYCHDNGTNGDECENDPVAFSYLPVSAAGSNRLVALGRVNGNASTDVAGGSFTVTKGGTGQWFLGVSGHTSATGTLIVSAEGGDGNNADNIVTSEWDADNGRWIIESRDLPAAALQNMAEGTEDVFSFAFFSMGASTGTPPMVSLDGPADGTSISSGTALTLTASAGDDGTVAFVRFYDGDTLLAEDRSAPYQFVWNQPPLGAHRLNARATDHLGFVSRSNTHRIAVTPAAGSGGLFFDGSDDYATFGNNTPLQLATFTLECWFRREPGGVATDSGGLNAIPLIAKGRADATGANFFLGIDAGTGRLAADFRGNDGNDHPLKGSTATATGVWQQAAVTYDGTTLNLYLNGNLEASLDSEGQPPRSETAQHVSLATAINASGTPAGAFLGMLDEVRIWNRARSAAEIRAGLNQEIPAAAGLVSRHAMNESSGTTLQNSAGQNLTGVLVNGAFRTTGAPFDLNTPPGIEPLSPLHQQSGVSRNAVLTTLTGDPEDPALTVRYFGRNTASGPLEDFTIIALPDTQFYSENTGGNLAAIFSAQTDWIVAQRGPLKIAGVLHLGDISQHGDNPSTSAAEWKNASTAMYRLENPLTTLLPHGIPYSMAVGNHDQTPIGNADGTTTGFNTYFGVHPSTRINHFAGKPYYGGTSIPGSADNNYILFSAGGVDFIVITFEYDNTPDPDDLEWADRLLKAHPTRCGIITTHWTVNTGNPGSFSPQGSAIYEALKDNPNLILLHGGHIAGEGRRSDTFEGRTVHSLLADYQSRTNGGDGWLRILKFRPALNRIEVQTYSPTLNRYETDADSKFTLNADLSGRGQPFVEIGAVSGAPGEVSLAWNGLDAATRYEWYAEVGDGLSVTKTPVRTFTTAGTRFPPTSSFTAPANGTSFEQGKPITLEVATADADGSVTAVRYFSGTTFLGETNAAPHSFIWKDAPLGVHTLIARAIDNDGMEAAALPVEIHVVAGSSLPTVTLRTSDATAGEHGPDSSLAFTVTREGTPTGALDVNYTLSGTAVPALDFTALPGSVRIPDGQSTASITTTVLADDLAEGSESLVLTLTAAPAYRIGDPSTAQSVISDRPFGEWLHANGLGPAGGDDDGDGLANIVEYYMGSRGDQSSEYRTMKAISAVDGRFTAVFPHAKDAVDVTGEPEWSTDLRTWHRSGQNDGTRTALITIRPISLAGEDPELLEATATITSGPSAASFFLRLAVRP